MARRLFNLLALLSFLAIICLSTLWARQRHRFVPKARIPRQRSAYVMDRTVEAQLERQLPGVTFEDISVSDALYFMWDASGAEMDMDWRAFDSSKTITLRLNRMQFAAALARVVDAAGLAYAQDGSRICVSTKCDLRRIGTAYRPRWPWPSDEDLQVQFGRYDDLHRHDLHAGSPPTLGSTFEAAGREFEAQPDAKWEALRPLGLTPQVRTDVKYGGGKEWFEAVLRHASLDQDVQYQVRNGRLLIAPKEWFDRDERAARWTAVAIGAGTIVAWSAILLNVRRRPRARGLFVAGSVLLLTTVLASWIWKTRSTGLECALLDHRIAIDERTAGQFVVRVKPAFLPVRRLRGREPAAATQFASLEWHGVSLERGGTLGSEISLVAPCTLFVGIGFVFPSLWFILTMRRIVRRARRIRAGCCVGCGYDLRASGERCPECGLQV